MCRGAHYKHRILQARDDIEFNELVIDRRAGTEFHAVANFFPKRIEGISGTQAVRSALWIFATGGVAASFNLLDGDFESHKRT